MYQIPSLRPSSARFLRRALRRTRQSGCRPPPLRFTNLRQKPLPASTIAGISSTFSPGMIITLLFGLWSASTIKSREPLFFLTIWYFFFAQMITAMLAMNISRMKQFPRPAMLLGTIVMWALVLVFPALMARKLAAPGATEHIVAFALMIVVNSIFVPLLRTPTKAGVLLKQKIAGYRQFLESVESDQLDRLADHGFNPVSNEHLAYAIALGVRQSWGGALERTTATASTSV